MSQPTSQPMPQHSAPIAEHPDLLDLRARYERAAESAFAQSIDGLTFMAGLYVALAAWIVGYPASTPLMMSNLITGIAITGLGAAYAAAFERTHRLAWVCPVLGAWTAVSPWVINGAPTTTRVVVSNLIAGGAVALLGLANLGPSYWTPRRMAR